MGDFMRRTRLGVAGLVVTHGWLYEQRDSRGGLEKEVLVRHIVLNRRNMSMEQTEDLIEMAKRGLAIYEDKGKIYLNLPWNRRKQEYGSRVIDPKTGAWKDYRPKRIRDPAP